jgi:small conductance mechanosensitive channel
VLRDLSGVVHVVQNGKIESLANMTKEWSAMVFEIGVAYKQEVDEAVAVMKEVAQSLQDDPDYGAKILEPMEVFGVESFGDSAVVIKGRIKTRPSEQWSVGREYRRRLKSTFDERNIEIPFPHRTLYWGEASAPMQFRTVNGLGPHSRPSQRSHSDRPMPPPPPPPNQRPSDGPRSLGK